MEWLPLCCDMLRMGDRQTSRRVSESPLRKEEEYPHLSPQLSWKYIFTPAFLFMPAPLLNAQGYWICLSLSERSAYTFLVVPFVLSMWHLSADDSPPQDKAACWCYLRGMIAALKKKKSHIQTMENGSHSDRPEESLKTLYPIIKTYISATSGRKKETSLFYEILICDFSGERH